MPRREKVAERRQRNGEMATRQVGQAHMAVTAWLAYHTRHENVCMGAMPFPSSHAYPMSMSQHALHEKLTKCTLFYIR